MNLLKMLLDEPLAPLGPFMSSRLMLLLSSSSLSQLELEVSSLMRLPRRLTLVLVLISPVDAFRRKKPPMPPKLRLLDVLCSVCSISRLSPSDMDEAVRDRLGFFLLLLACTSRLLHLLLAVMVLAVVTAVSIELFLFVGA